ncbi:carbohydrate sulfotransferase 15 isoform X3 [Danio rerio]|uniref:Carbohydrate sulfotransferase 15 isoform X3 n=1 Tax=Danio rerio TaxID=7955 RepID=A0AC58GZN1_DANRE
MESDRILTAPPGGRCRSPCCRCWFLLFLLLLFISVSFILCVEWRSALFTTAVFLGYDAAPQDLSEDTLRDVVRRIFTKVNFTHRRVPEVRELHRLNTHLFSVIPPHFLPEVRNPCWFQELRGDVSADPYSSNLFTGLFMQPVFAHLNASFRQSLLLHDGKLLRFRCLPYFYIIGQPKCGTTDLYERLQLHPHVQLTALKEPHWWSRKRFGILLPGEPPKHLFPLDHYLDLFDPVARQIQHRVLGNSSWSIITGEASASTMWDSSGCEYMHGCSSGPEPLSLTQDFLHALQPHARFIAILRDPVERLYSDYLYFGSSNKSAQDFQLKVRLQVGLYVVFVLDWLSVFSRDQLLVVRLEDHAADPARSMRSVFRFLGLEPVSAQTELLISKRPVSNSRRAAASSLGPMSTHTRDLLTHFYTPFNKRLCAALQDQAFMWDHRSAHA